MSDNSISFEEAKKVIEEYFDEDDFITKNVRMFLGRDGEPNDNSIELSDYYRKCKEIINEQNFHKHG